MGYQVNYTITTTEGDLTSEQILLLEKISNISFDWTNPCGVDTPGWGDHHENMLEFSKHYPKEIFLLECDGETLDDHCIYAYQNGKYGYDSIAICLPSEDLALQALENNQKSIKNK